MRRLAVARVFSIAFWSFFALTCVTCFVVALTLWIVTLPFDRDRRINHLFSCAWGALYAIAYPGWTVRVTGRDRIVRGTPYVIVANHTSIADIVLCFCLFRQFKWVSKATVFKYPFLGWNMWLSRYVPLRRGDKDSIAAMMARSRMWLSRGISLMMFPEGTRSPDGAVLPFKHGAFTLALDAGVQVVPVAIHGGHELIPKHGGTFATQATLHVEVLDPVTAPEGATAEVFADVVRARIVAALSAPDAHRRAA